MKCLQLAVLAVGLAMIAGCSSNGVKQAEEAKKIDLIIGTYSQDGSEGVYAAEFNLTSGELSEPRLALKSMHPTYLATSDAGVIYGAMRDPGGRVTAFRPVGEKDFTTVNQLSSQGDWPCYLAFSADQNYIAAANYKGGSVVVFEIGEGGMLKPNPQLIQHSGKGTNPDRQEAPHAHWVQWSPYNYNVLYAIDLGLDQISMHAFDPKTGQLGPRKIAFESPPGEGPRHMVFHPTKKLGYIMHELTNTVHLVKVNDDNTFTFVASRSTLPEGFSGKNQGAHIAISDDGKHLYTSNRGLNSIAIFDLDDTGVMTLRENVSTGGDWPRFFKLFDEYGYMLVANRFSGDITVFKVGDDGGLTQTDEQMKIPHPTYVDEYSH